MNWDISLDEFIKQVLPVLRDHQVRNKLQDKVVKLAACFLRIKFDRKELKRSINDEVAIAIDEALVYYVNVKGEEAI